MNPGHIEHFGRRLDRSASLGWRPDYKIRDRAVADVAYGQYADFGVKAGVSIVSAGLLIQAETPVEKILFGISTAILGAITLASAYETF